MKLQLAIALAVLAVSGAAMAQDQQGQQGVSIPNPSVTALPGKDIGYRPGLAPELLAARYRLRRACAADLLARCPNKDGGAADRCLEYHRVSFTLPCRKAITAFERVAPPRTAYESLASLAPVSGPIPPPDQREAPAPSRTGPRAGTGR
jgi:hypothetical protein